MYSACQVKGPFDSTHAKDSNPIQAQPKEKIDIDPPIFDKDNNNNNIDDKALDDIYEVLTPAQLRAKADHYIKDNLNKYTKKAKKNQK